MIPPEPHHDLMRAMADAETLAAQGKVTTGLSLLLAGLLRAQADQEIGQPWAEELIHHYDQAMDRYAVGHGLRPNATVRQSVA